MPPTNCCNGNLIKHLRSLLEWTQEDLAHNAGLSVRALAKAESGREPVGLATVQAIAEAFSKANHLTTPEDLWSDPASLAREFLKNYAVHQAECVQHSLDFLSPDIVAFVDGDPDTNPIAGTYRGIDDFEGLWRKFFTLFVRDGGTLGDSPEIKCFGNEVLAWGYEFIRVPESSPTPAGFVQLRMRFEAGMMTYFEDRYETTGMMDHLKRWSEEFPDAAWVAILNKEALRTGEYLRRLDPPVSPMR